MRKGELVNFTLTGHTGVKRGRWKDRLKFFLLMGDVPRKNWDDK